MCSVKADRLPRIVDPSTNTDIFRSTTSFDTNSEAICLIIPVSPQCDLFQHLFHFSFAISLRICGQLMVNNILTNHKER
jgi:hypothetical protein